MAVVDTHVVDDKQSKLEKHGMEHAWCFRGTLDIYFELFDLFTYLNLFQLRFANFLGKYSQQLIKVEVTW